MIPKLLRFTALLSVLAAAPAANAQAVFADTNLDSMCTFEDYIEVGTTDTVWVWFDTNHTLTGTPVTCSTGEPLTMADYELCLFVDSYAHGHQPLTVGRWINKVPEFSDSLDFRVASDPAGFKMVHVYWSSSGASTHLPPGKHLLGGLEVTMNQPGCNTVMFTSAFSLDPTATTGFYSDCPGFEGDNRIRLGDDFADACSGGAICSPVSSTTWGSIKSRYR